MVHKSLLQNGKGPTSQFAAYSTGSRSGDYNDNTPDAKAGYQQEGIRQWMTRHPRHRSRGCSPATGPPRPLYVAAKLGLADLLKNGPRTADDLASATQTHPRSLYRLLRALASVGVFAADDRQRFSLTPLADCLRTDVPGSQRALAIMAGEEHYRAFGDLLYSVKTGKTAFDKIYGMPIFDYSGTASRPGKQF